jgi:hypothetical protein
MTGLGEATAAARSAQADAHEAERPGAGAHVHFDNQSGVLRGSAGLLVLPVCSFGPLTRRGATGAREETTSLANGAADARVDTAEGDASVRSRQNTTEGNTTGGKRDRDCAIGAESEEGPEGGDGLTDVGDSRAGTPGPMAGLGAATDVARGAHAGRGTDGNAQSAGESRGSTRLPVLSVCPFGPFSHRAAGPREATRGLAGGSVDARVDVAAGDASVRSRPNTAEGNAAGGKRNRDCALGAETDEALDGRDGPMDGGTDGAPARRLGTTDEGEKRVGTPGPMTRPGAATAATRRAHADEGGGDTYARTGDDANDESGNAPRHSKRRHKGGRSHARKHRNRTEAHVALSTEGTDGGSSTRDEN